MKLFRNALNNEQTVAQNNKVELNDQDLANVNGGCSNEYHFNRGHDHDHEQSHNHFGHGHENHFHHDFHRHHRHHCR